MLSLHDLNFENIIRLEDARVPGRDYHPTSR
jgi:hypothetical protein